MEAVLSLRRDPPFHLYVWGLWAKVPTLMWFTVLALDAYATFLASRVH